MRKTILFLSIILIAALPSCKKDLTTSWVGTYNGTAGGNTFNQVVITKVDDNTIKMELKTLVLGATVTYATIANGKISGNTVTVSEDGSVIGTTGTWHFTGSGNLSGSTLVLNGAATQTGQNTLYYTFTGSK